MIKKYFRLIEEAKDLEAEMRRKVRSLENEMRHKLSALEDETGKTIAPSFCMGRLTVNGTHFHSSLHDNETWSTTSLCKETDEPNTLEVAVKEVKEMFKAKKEWEELLIKISEVLKQG